MARCPRCNACESQWSSASCPTCGFPSAYDSRSVLKLATDLQADISDAIDGGEECTGRDTQLTQWIETLDSLINKLKQEVAT